MWQLLRTATSAVSSSFYRKTVERTGSLHHVCRQDDQI
jgi:hypothetical protein